MSLHNTTPVAPQQTFTETDPTETDCVLGKPRIPTASCSRAEMEHSATDMSSCFIASLIHVLAGKAVNACLALQGLQWGTHAVHVCAPGQLDWRSDQELH
jgi:hypothetical protein